MTESSWSIGCDATSAIDVANEGGGLLRLITILPSDIPRLMAATSSGCAASSKLLAPVLQLAAHMRDRRGKARCACCGRGLRGEFVTMIVLPDCEEAEPKLAAAVCMACAPDGAAADEASLRVIRRIWPTSRSIEDFDARLHQAARA